MSTARNISPPAWIKNLPPGEYDSIELMKITGLAYSSISSTIKKYGAQVKKIPCWRNLHKNIYVWSGYKSGNKDREVM